MLDKDDIKNSLSLEQVFDLVAELGGEPQLKDGYLISKTICHNKRGEGTYKLYYWENTHLFHCFTDCGDSFDLFSLVMKVQKISLYQAIVYVANYFGIILFDDQEEVSLDRLADWDIFKNYEKDKEIKEKPRVELNIYDKSILSYLPHPHIIEWEKDGISKEVMDDCGIAYNAVNHSVIIPHYDIDNNLIGIRERTLIQEEEKYGKYKPAVLNGKMYNHPLGFSLYNLNRTKDNIKVIKKAIVAEGEKSSLQCETFLGKENNICVACCGSSLISYQVSLLLSLGVQEVIIAFDKQFKEIGDAEWVRWTEKLCNMHKKYGKYVQISYLFDKENLLTYKDSPFDKGKDTFFQLFQERVIL